MSMFRTLSVSVLAVLAVAASSPAPAQNFPDHPVKIIVPYPPGGPADNVARVTTQGLGAELGGSVIIENLPGAGGRLGTKEAGRAAPDGYTLLLGSSNEYAITPALYGNLDFDPARELSGVASLVTDSVAIAVNPSLPVHSLKELAAYAKDHPGITSGATVGIVPHLALMYFQVYMGANIVFVPYKGAAPALADAIGNHIQVTSSAKSAILPLIKSGKLRALAVSSNERWPELPDVPTFRDGGLDGFPPVVVFALLAPKGTPPNIVAKITAAETARLKSAEVQAAIARIGLSPLVLDQPQLAKALDDEVRLWKAVIAKAGVHLE